MKDNALNPLTEDQKTAVLELIQDKLEEHHKERGKYISILEYGLLVEIFSCGGTTPLVKN